MFRKEFVKILLVSFTFIFTHAKAEKEDLTLSNALKRNEFFGDTTTDACDSEKDCNYLGECIKVAGRKICDCRDGLSGDNCEIIDECVQHSGMCGTNSDSECSYHRKKERAYCKCKEKGKRFDASTKQCLLQKPCLNQNDCHNGGECRGDKDAKYCECSYGTSGDYCDEIEECVENPDLCGSEASCRYNTLLLRAFCYCDDINQRYDWPLKSCVNRSECKSNEECKNDGICTDHCQIWEPCNYTDIENKRSCHCVEGTSGHKCEIVDDCFNKIVDCGTGDNVVCKYFYNPGVEGFAYCECTNSNQKFEQISKTCKDCDCGNKSRECFFQKGIKGCKCESDAYNFGDKCEDCKCGEGSNGCNFKDGVKECFCNPGYKELNGICEKCDCGSKSTDCKFEDGKKVCTCEPGFKPGNYSICTPMCDDKKACANGGRCLQDICVCLAGTGGQYCEKVYDCEKKLCGDSSAVRCLYDSLTQRALCQCNNVQHTYDSYDKSCKKCSCGNSLGTDRDKCDFVLGKKVCQCSKGYAFNHKADKCSECFCGNNSTCSFEENGGKVCQCSKGYIENLGTCKRCECGPNGVCSFNSNGKFSKCVCDSSFSENSGKCVFCYCGPNSKCSFRNKRKVCTCAKGYKDVDGYCTDIDECLNTEACPGAGTLCENTLGSYKCRCQIGYQGRLPTESDKKSLCEKIAGAQPNYTPWKIGYGLLTVGFLAIIIGLAYIIFRMRKSWKTSPSNLVLRHRNQDTTTA